MQPAQDSLTPANGRISLRIAVTAISGDQRQSNLSSIVYVNQMHSIRLELPIRPTRRTFRSQIEGTHDEGTPEALSARDAVTKARKAALNEPKKSATKAQTKIDEMWCNDCRRCPSPLTRTLTPAPEPSPAHPPTTPAGASHACTPAQRRREPTTSRAAVPS